MLKMKKRLCLGMVVALLLSVLLVPVSAVKVDDTGTTSTDAVGYSLSRVGKVDLTGVTDILRHAETADSTSYQVKDK